MLVDLTLPLDSKVTQVPGHPRFNATPISTLREDGRANTLVTFSIHTATHADAPSHFVLGGVPINSVPLNRFYGRALHVDLRPVAARHVITIDELRRAGCPEAAALRDRIVVLHTDWVTEHAYREDLYSASPYLSQEAANWLADASIRLLGLDFATDGNPPYPNHRIFLERGIPIIENLIHLDRVPKEFTLMAFPIAFRDENGASVRAVAEF